MDTTEHAKFIAGQGSNRVEFEADVSDVEEWKVKITIDGKKSVIPFKDLYSFVFFTANEQQQDTLIPVKQIQVKKLVKWHRVQAKKDIRKGELINVRCETNVENEVYQGLKGMLPKSNPTTRATSFNIPIIGAKKNG